MDTALRQGARIVWLPTVHAANHLRHYGGPSFGAATPPSRPIEGVEVVDAGGRALPELIEIVDLVRDAGAVRARGHLSPAEIATTARAARERGLARVLVTHPDHPVCALDLDAQRDLARGGAMLELTVLSFRKEWGGLPRATAIDHMRAIGIDRFVITSDLGQRDSGEPFEAFARECEALLANGLRDDELDRALRDAPRELIGLDAHAGLSGYAHRLATRG